MVHYVCKPTRVAPVANLERLGALLRPDFCAFKYLRTEWPLQIANRIMAQEMQTSAVPSLFKSYRSPASGTGTLERSLLMARSTVRFISETTPRTLR